MIYLASNNIKCLKQDNLRMKNVFLNCHKCSIEIKNTDLMYAKRSSKKIKYYHSSCWDKLLL